MIPTAMAYDSTGMNDDLVELRQLAMEVRQIAALTRLEMHNLVPSGRDEAARLKARLQARDVIGLLMHDLPDSLHSSRDLQVVSEQIGDDLEQILMSFQLQDSLMQRGDGAGQVEAPEPACTMAVHHGRHHVTAGIQRNAGADFF